MKTMIDDLGKEHGRFRKYLTAYRAEIDKLANGSDVDFDLLEQLADYFAQYPDELHHKKEDIIYTRLEADYLANRPDLIDLEAEHEELSRHAQDFADIVHKVLGEAEVSIADIVDKAARYDEMLTSHMKREEETLFMPALESFDKRDWEDVNELIGELYAEAVNVEKMKQVLEIEDRLDSYFS